MMLSFMMTGCLGPVRVPPQSTYTITSLQAPLGYRSSRTNLILLISIPDASPGYNTANMIYVTIPYKLRSFANNHWVAPPGEMLAPLLAQELRNTSYFRAVVNAPYSGYADYRLDTQLLVLEQEFLQPISQVRIVMQATLINNSNNRVVVSRRFQEFAPAPENNPYSGVLATNLAAAAISKDITHFVLHFVSLARS